MSEEDSKTSEYRSTIDADHVLRERFAKGQGVILLSPDMTDEVMLLTIKRAISISDGKPFVVIAAPRV